MRPDAAIYTAAAARIDRTLRVDGANAIKAAEACQEMGFDPEAWTCDVDLTMAGPHYLSLVAFDSYYCGGPYLLKRAAFNDRASAIA